MTFGRAVLRRRCLDHQTRSDSQAHYAISTIYGWSEACGLGQALAGDSESWLGFRERPARHVGPDRDRLPRGRAMTQWPCAHACGFKLGIYLAAVGMVIVVGAWGGSFAWKDRLVLAHIVSQGLLIWGFVVGSVEISSLFSSQPPGVELPARCGVPVA